MILSFDVGGTFIKWALIDCYEIKEKGKVPTPYDSFETFLKTIEPIMLIIAAIFILFFGIKFYSSYVESLFSAL